LAALAVHDPGRGFDDDVVQMTAAANQTRHGAVTVATRAAMTTAGECEPGDVLGVVDGDFAFVGADLGEVAVAVVDRLLAGSGELLTVVSGAEAPAVLVARVEDHVGRSRPDVDVLVHAGGQTGYPLLLAVE
jgi:dihydroxyacetone kinase-like predicted kinase